MTDGRLQLAGLSPEEKSQAVAGLIHRLLAEARLTTKAAERAGKHRDYYRKVVKFKPAGGLDVTALLAALEVLGTHPTEFFQDYFETNLVAYARGEL